MLSGAAKNLIPSILKGLKIRNPQGKGLNFLLFFWLFWLFKRVGERQDFPGLQQYAGHRQNGQNI